MPYRVIFAAKCQDGSVHNFYVDFQCRQDYAVYAEWDWGHYEIWDEANTVMPQGFYVADCVEVEERGDADKVVAKGPELVLSAELMGKAERYYHRNPEFYRR